MIMRKPATLCGCLFSVLSGVASATNVFNMEGFGAVSRSLGGAGVAGDIGAPAMMYNPATLGLMARGSQVHVGVDLVSTDIDVRNRATGEKVSSGKSSFSKNRGPAYFTPEFAVTHGGDAVTFGVGVFAQGGVGTEFGNRSFLSRTTTNGIDTGLENSTRLLNLRIPFAAAFNLNDKLTVGASLDAVWTQLNLELLFDASQVGSLIADGRASGALVPVLGGLPALSGVHLGFTKDKIAGGGADAWGLGGKLGLTWQVLDSTRLGAAYNFKTRVSDLSGRATLTAVDALLGQIPLRGDVEVRDLQNPARFSLGVSHALNSQWTVVADYQRVFWEDVMEDVDIGFVDDASGADLDILLPQDYDDITIYSVGAEYRHSNSWTFRAGFSHADQALQSNLLFAILPAYLQDHVAGGLTYAWSGHDKIEVAVTYAFEETMRNSSQPNTSVPIESRHAQINGTLSYVHRF